MPLRFMLVLAFILMLLAMTTSPVLADGWPSCCAPST